MKHAAWAGAALLAFASLAAAEGKTKPADDGAERLQADLRALKLDRERLQAARRDGNPVAVAAQEAALTDDEERVRMDRQWLQVDPKAPPRPAKAAPKKPSGAAAASRPRP